MSRRPRFMLFGLFDEQAISVLSAIESGASSFGEMGNKTGLSKASLFRVLTALDESGCMQKTKGRYRLSLLGRQTLTLADKIAARHTDIAIKKASQRLREMKLEYKTEGRVFHSDPLWERTSEKPLAEVLAVHEMTGRESLMFHQKFEEEARNEEHALRRRSSVQH